MDIHKNLGNDEVRNFLAELYVKSLTEENIYLERLTPEFALVYNSTNKRTYKHDIEGALNYLIEEVKIKTKLINILNHRKALNVIVSNLNWKIHDVSDWVIRIEGEKFVRPFIGNQIEYEKFKEKIMLNQ